GYYDVAVIVYCQVADDIGVGSTTVVSFDTVAIKSGIECAVCVQTYKQHIYTYSCRIAAQHQLAVGLHLAAQGDIGTSQRGIYSNHTIIAISGIGCTCQVGAEHIGIEIAPEGSRAYEIHTIVGCIYNAGVQIFPAHISITISARAIGAEGRVYLSGALGSCHYRQNCSYENA